MGQIADLISSVLAGEDPPEALGPSWRHDLAMPIYERARAILAMPKAERRAEIEKHAPAIKSLVASEVTRLYNLAK